MDEIKYPKKQSEAEVQSILWSLLREKGLDARLQVIGNINGKKHKFDIVIFKYGKPQSIIECKSWAKIYREARLDSKQLHKYERYGLPVFLCVNFASISKVFKHVLSSYSQRDFEHI